MIIKAVWNTTSEPGSNKDKYVISDGAPVANINHDQDVTSSDEQGVDSNSDEDTNSNSDEDTESRDNENENADIEEDLVLVNHQLEAILTLQHLAQTCTKLRDEVLTEFFANALSRTQIHLGNAYPVSRPYRRLINPYPGKQLPVGFATANGRIFEELSASCLFTTHIQHVSLHWPSCWCRRWSHFTGVCRPDAVLDWLADTCKQLKTLELVFTDPLYPKEGQFSKAYVPGVRDPEEPWERMWNEHDLFCDDCRRKLARVMSRLDKVVGRPWYPHHNPDIAGRFHTVVFREHGEWVADAWFMRERAAAAAVEEAGQGATAVVKKTSGSQYKFAHHFGAIDVVWPLADTI